MEINNNMAQHKLARKAWHLTVGRPALWKLLSISQRSANYLSVYVCVGLPALLNISKIWSAANLTGEPSAFSFELKNLCNLRNLRITLSFQLIRQRRILLLNFEPFSAIIQIYDLHLSCNLLRPVFLRSSCTPHWQRKYQLIEKRWKNRTKKILIDIRINWRNKLI